MRAFADASTQFRPTLFGQLTDDLSAHSYLALRLRAGGHPRTRNSYFVNVQTDGSFKNDLWQHRLFFNRSDGGWEDVFVRVSPYLRFPFCCRSEARKHGRPISWDRLPYATQPLLNMEDAERQKITVRILCSYASGPLTSALKFIEIWNEDGVTAEPEDDFA